MASSGRLPPPARLLGVAANIALGILPSLAFFAWMERGCSLPYIGPQLGWPWLSLPALEPWGEAGVDVLLFLGFGLVHTALAQARAHGWLEKVFPAQTLRTFYLAATGLAAVAVMGCWQNTGVVIWAAPLPPRISLAVSMAIFWSLLGACAVIMSRFDALHFFGLRQLYSTRAELTRTSGNTELSRSGIYARVRHPIYTLTLAALLLTPVMTLDRAVLLTAMGLYLSAGTPIEERKLVAIFGNAYVEYRKQVPAVIPRLFRVQS
jgi:protein-S-isoprenylcysteine O-methyltransferase Ste14